MSGLLQDWYHGTAQRTHLVHPLIRDGIMVAGRTVEQVAAEITQKLDEFIYRSEGHRYTRQGSSHAI